MASEIFNLKKLLDEWSKDYREQNYTDVVLENGNVIRVWEEPRSTPKKHIPTFESLTK